MLSEMAPLTAAVLLLVSPKLAASVWLTEKLPAWLAFGLSANVLASLMAADRAATLLAESASAMGSLIAEVAPKTLLAESVRGKASEMVEVNPVASLLV
jgi:hypothetical protein